MLQKQINKNKKKQKKMACATLQVPVLQVVNSMQKHLAKRESFPLLFLFRS